MASTHGSTSSAVGKIWLTGVSRSGNGSTMPPSPSVSGRAPRSEPMTGMPLIMASTATSPCDSHQSEGINTILVNRQNRRGIGGDRHDLDIGMVLGPEPAGAQRLPCLAALDDQKRDIGPPPPQLLGDPDKRINAFVPCRIDKRHKPRVGLATRTRAPSRPGWAAPGSRGRPDRDNAAQRTRTARCNNRPGKSAGRACTQSYGVANTTGMPRCLATAIIPCVIGIAAVGEHHVGPVDIEELREEVHDRADLVQALLAVPGRFLADEGDRDIVPARVEHAGVIGTADRGTKLIRLVQVVDHFFEANLRGEIELGGAERLAFEAVRRQPLEHIQSGHGGAVGKVEDRSVPTRTGFSCAEIAPRVRRPGSVLERVDGAVMDVGSQTVDGKVFQSRAGNERPTGIVTGSLSLGRGLGVRSGLPTALKSDRMMRIHSEVQLYLRMVIKHFRLVHVRRLPALMPTRLLTPAALPKERELVLPTRRLSGWRCSPALQSVPVDKSAFFSRSRFALPQRENLLS